MNLSVFSDSYAQARQQFLDACGQRGYPVQSHLHPLPGRDGEALALDVCRVGPATARNLLVVSSGCHGIEGFCGSAVQLDLLASDDWAASSARPDLAVLYLHALNPYGFSWLRRVTHENVDLNRNFLDFSQPPIANPGYAAIADLLLPEQWPPSRWNLLQLLWFAARKGRKTLQSAISSGQQSHPDGLFFSGTEPTWSNRQLRQVLREHARQCQRIGWIDVHTGLGSQGVGERIYKGAGSAEDLARAKAWWGPQVTNSFDGSSTSAHLRGTLDLAVMEECPQAQYNGLTLEYGTLPGPEVLQALRAEQWLQRHPRTGAQQHAQIKQQIRRAFYVQTEPWQRQVLQQSREVCWQTLKGLSHADLTP
ncbi:M14 family metallopeptidase [Pseudomonas sp. HR96]|uniref:M14 family metallopeptidase n=1 Tax=Pseudomonas sp. HR96 TaxID=1027966 RepID=UPI002A75D219|nr:M14 family metallopeptidase [Pseudomonas sp. HR96]WPP02067.1 M14 family metallopeptidase [Pseudomonas sp. HR96]